MSCPVSSMDSKTTVDVPQTNPSREILVRNNIAISDDTVLPEGG